MIDRTYRNKKLDFSLMIDKLQKKKTNNNDVSASSDLTLSEKITKFNNLSNGLLQNTKYKNCFKVTRSLIYANTFSEFNRIFNDTKPFELFFNDNVRCNEDTKEIYYIESKSKYGKMLAHDTNINYFKGRANTTRLYYLNLERGLETGKFYDMDTELNLPNWVTSIYELYDLAMHPDGIFLSACCNINPNKAVLEVPEFQNCKNHISGDWQKNRTNNGTRVLLVFFIPKNGSFKDSKIINKEWYNDNFDASFLMYGNHHYYSGLAFCKIRNKLYMNGIHWRNDNRDRSVFIVYEYNRSIDKVISRQKVDNQSIIYNQSKRNWYDNNNLGPMIMDDRNQEEDHIYLYTPFTSILKIHKDDLNSSTHKMKVIYSWADPRSAGEYISRNYLPEGINPASNILNILIPKNNLNNIFFRTNNLVYSEYYDEGKCEELFNGYIRWNFKQRNCSNEYSKEDIYHDFNNISRVSTELMTRYHNKDIRYNKKFNNAYGYNGLESDPFWNYKYNFMTAMCADENYVYSLSHDGHKWDKEQDVNLCITSVNDINRMKMIPLRDIIPQQYDKNMEVLSMIRYDNKLLLFNSIKWQGKNNYQVYKNKDNLMFGIIEIDLTDFLRSFGIAKEDNSLLYDSFYNLKILSYTDPYGKKYTNEEIENNVKISGIPYSFDKNPDYNYFTKKTDRISIALPGEIIIKIDIRKYTDETKNDSYIVESINHKIYNKWSPDRLKNVNYHFYSTNIILSWDPEESATSYDVVSKEYLTSNNYHSYVHNIKTTEIIINNLSLNSEHDIVVYGKNEKGHGIPYILPTIKLLKNFF